jgi:tRNA nucleotidyltransferase (CCA-adding enzyme)
VRLRLEEGVTAEEARRLAEIGQLAAELGLPAYLVGGPVRDAVLGRAPLDLDITVVGPAPQLAERLAEHFGGRLTSHDRFGTAVVQMPDWHVDVATARRETYPQPGALPEVEPSDLDEDLRRRDFSYNAMALRLDRDLGELCDPLGGLADLQARVTRALHERSFVDDPTRIIRAARYAARFGCRLEPLTQRWLEAAVAGGALGTVTGQRLWGELSRLLAEESAPDAVGLLESWGVLTVLRLTCASTDDLRALHMAQEALGPALTDMDRAMAALGLLGGDRMAALAEFFGLSALEATAAQGVAEAVATPPPVLFAGEPKNSTLYEALHGLPGAAWLTLWVRCPDTRPLLQRFMTLSPCLAIDGHDLQAEGFSPSPGFTPALEAARRAKLDEDADRAGQLAAAVAVLEDWQAEHDG